MSTLTLPDLFTVLRVSDSTLRRYVRNGTLPQGVRTGTTWDAAAVQQAIASHGHLQQLALMSRKAALMTVPLTDDPADLERYAAFLRTKGQDGLASMLPGSLYPVARALTVDHNFTLALQELAYWTKEAHPSRIHPEALYKSIMAAMRDGFSLIDGGTESPHLQTFALCVRHDASCTVAVAVECAGDYADCGETALQCAFPSLQPWKPGTKRFARKLQSWAEAWLQEPEVDKPSALDWHRRLTSGKLPHRWKLVPA